MHMQKPKPPASVTTILVYKVFCITPRPSQSCGGTVSSVADVVYHSIFRWNWQRMHSGSRLTSAPHSSVAPCSLFTERSRAQRRMEADISGG